MANAYHSEQTPIQKVLCTANALNVYQHLFDDADSAAKLVLP